jgi:muramoyltetrapeptide carboxypeptidase
MDYIIPRPLKKGDTIGLVSPSSPLQSGALVDGVKYIEAMGFKVRLGNHINDSDRFLAGEDVNRAKDVMDFFKDPEISAIIATRGGQGSQRLLPLLDYDLVRANPKILVGFSDTTALQLGLLKKAGLVSFTGFTMTVKPNPLIDRTLASCLNDEPYEIVDGVPVSPGRVEGLLVGGNLSLLTSLIGTPYQPDFKGSILLFEDVGVEPYNVDRMLSHLALAGIFDEVAGLIIGQFVNCVSTNPQEGTVEEVVNEWSLRFKGPCLRDFPYGHGERRCVLPIGKSVKLDVDARTVRIL